MAPPTQPHLTHMKEVTFLCEVDDFETGAFLRSTFVYIDEYDHVWYCQHPIPKRQVDVDDVNRDFKLIPDEKIYPRRTSSITAVEDARDAFIKRPKAYHVDSEDGVAEILPLMLYQEAEVLEILTQHPHPNLVRYLGCRVRGDYIVGIALEKHDIILEYYFEDFSQKLDNNLVIEDLRAGVKHLHSLGFAHNDLHPGNIALDRHHRPVILDFGSCKKFGETLVSAGTPGWADDYFTSEAQHDEDAIERIRLWLEQQSSKAQIQNE